MAEKYAKNDRRNYQIPDFARTLCCNGWTHQGKWLCDDEPATFKLDLTYAYQSFCYAKVIVFHQQLCVNEYFGVAWIEVETENSAPYIKRDLDQMFGAIAQAENNLLMLGVPFSPDYRFTGENADEKKKKNEILRQERRLREIEDFWNARDNEGNLIEED